MSTIVEGDFEWDSKKAASNVTKHGISFAEAATVFADPMAVYLDDGSGTERMVVIGAAFASSLRRACAAGRTRSDYQCAPGDIGRTRRL